MASKNSAMFYRNYAQRCLNRAWDAIQRTGEMTSHLVQQAEDYHDLCTRTLFGGIDPDLRVPDLAFPAREGLLLFKSHIYTHIYYAETAPTIRKFHDLRQEFEWAQDDPRIQANPVPTYQRIGDEALNIERAVQTHMRLHDEAQTLDKIAAWKDRVLDWIIVGFFFLCLFLSCLVSHFHHLHPSSLGVHENY